MMNRLKTNIEVKASTQKILFRFLLLHKHKKKFIQQRNEIENSSNVAVVTAISNMYTQSEYRLSLPYYQSCSREREWRSLLRMWNGSRRGWDGLFYAQPIVVPAEVSRPQLLSAAVEWEGMC